MEAVDVARAVPDPEMPYLTLGDLGVVREAALDAEGTLRVAITPTYLGCPATEAIRQDVRTALIEAGWPRVAVEMRLDPPWTPDRITARGRAKLAEEGIAPPVLRGGSAAGPQFVELTPPPKRAAGDEDEDPARDQTAEKRPGANPSRASASALASTLAPRPAVPCPRCGAPETALLSAFGATPCQELRRCPACGEPFPAIKSAR